MTSENDDLSIEQRLVALTRDLILIPSIPSRPEDKMRCYEFIRNHLEPLVNIEIREFMKDGVPSLVAVPEGCSKPDVLMCGHLDVISHPDLALYRSYVEDGKIFGPGAGDMKGALAILIEIFRQIHADIPGASLGLAITADEETGGQAGIGYLFGEAGLRCGSALIPDGGSLTDITIEEKGILHLRVSCEGQSAHAARPWLGNNPIEHLMDALTRLRTYFDGFKTQNTNWYPTCAVTIFETENQTVNRIASNASAALDIRFPPPYSVELITKDVQAILGEYVQLNPIISAQPTHLSPDPVYQRTVEHITGESARLVRDDGGSDARYIAHDGTPVMMSRPRVGDLHAHNEWIDIKSMVTFYRIYEKYLTKKLKGKKE